MLGMISTANPFARASRSTLSAELSRVEEEIPVPVKYTLDENRQRGCIYGSAVPKAAKLHPALLSAEQLTLSLLTRADWPTV